MYEILYTLIVPIFSFCQTSNKYKQKYHNYNNQVEIMRVLNYVLVSLPELNKSRTFQKTQCGSDDRWQY